MGSNPTPGNNVPSRVKFKPALGPCLITPKNSTVHIAPCTVTEKSARRAAFETFNFAMDPSSFPAEE